MPNPLTNAPLASQTGTAPGANSMDTNQKTVESSFLSILNGLEPDVGSDQQEPVTKEPALDAEDLEEPAEPEASAPETADITTPSLEGPANQDTPRNNPEIQSSLAHFFPRKAHHQASRWIIRVRSICQPPISIRAKPAANRARDYNT